MSVTRSGGTHISGCCAVSSIGDFSDDRLLKSHPDRCDSLKIMKKDILKHIEGARAGGKSMLLATTNTNQKESAKLLKKLGFQSMPWAVRPETSPYGTRVKLHCFFLNTSEEESTV